MQINLAGSVSASLSSLISGAMTDNGGWLPFDRFMAMALYQPGLGYYARNSRQFGLMPQSGSDFVTAPELSPLFARALARQVAQALAACGGDQLYEFGAGSGVLALQLIDELDALGVELRRYSIVDLSASLRGRQQQRLERHRDRIHWLDSLPPTIDGVVVGNEVLDAMPVKLLHFDGSSWHERGVAAGAGGFEWADRATGLRPPLDQRWVAGSTIEIHPQAEGFVATLAERLRHGVALLFDYGFPESEYYHPQRHQGTLVCHRAHRVDTDPLADVGDKDITAHVNFSGIAMAAQDAGAEVIGYTSQAHFLFNCGLVPMLEKADLKQRADAQKLVNEHEMGELFKVIAFCRGCDSAFTADPLGFSHGDRSHSL